VASADLRLTTSGEARVSMCVGSKGKFPPRGSVMSPEAQIYQLVYFAGDSITAVYTRRAAFDAAGGLGAQ
jgi:hypothetical protein